MIERAPSQETEKPGVGEVPESHWNWVVGAVRMQPRPFWSVRPGRGSQYGVSDVEAEVMPTP